jgi:hypothetical protein
MLNFLNCTFSNTKVVKFIKAKHSSREINFPTTMLCAGWFCDFAQTYFCLREGGAERDDFDFGIFFAKKSQNQNHLSPKGLF